MSSTKLVPKTLSRNVTLEQVLAAERAMFPGWAAEAEQTRKNAIRPKKVDMAFETDMIPTRADKRQPSPTKTLAKSPKRTSPVHKSINAPIDVEVTVPKRPVRRAALTKPKAGTVKVTAATGKKKSSLGAKTTGSPSPKRRLVATRKKPQLISVDYFQKK